MDLARTPIPNVQVKILNRDSGVPQETVGNELGLYRVVALLPGTYQGGR